MMSEVYNNVSIEPHLQPLSGEALRFKTANSDSNSPLDIAANGFWGGKFEHSFFDVRVFNPGAPSNYPIQSHDLLIIAMRGRRDVSMSSVFERLNMAILHC